MDYLFKKHIMPVGKATMTAFKKGSVTPVKRFIGAGGSGVRRMRPL
jgi:hypothetical protein